MKRHTGADELLPHWQHELGDIGWTVERLATALEHARTVAPQLPLGLTGPEIDALAVEVLDAGGELMRRHKVFTRTRLIAEIAPRLYGHDPAELDSVIDRVLASRAVVPLIGLVDAHEQAYATAEVLATSTPSPRPSTASPTGPVPSLTRSRSTRQSAGPMTASAGSSPTGRSTPSAPCAARDAGSMW